MFVGIAKCDVSYCALHSLTEEICEDFPDFDKLTSNLIKIFVKTPLYVETFKDLAQSICESSPGEGHDLVL